MSQSDKLVKDIRSDSACKPRLSRRPSLPVYRSMKPLSPINSKKLTIKRTLVLKALETSKKLTFCRRMALPGGLSLENFQLASGTWVTTVLSVSPGIAALTGNVSISHTKL